MVKPSWFLFKEGLEFGFRTSLFDQRLQADPKFELFEGLLVGINELSVNSPIGSLKEPLNVF